MKISYQWLKAYAGFAANPEAIAVLLTDCGLEVEALEKRETVPGGLRGVYVAEVISCSKHPDANKLWLTRVDAGQGAVVPVVCGAPNVKAGQKVLLATPGTSLHTPQGPITIKKARIRGQDSEGMICAEDELGMGVSHDGIMVLDPATPVGMTAASYFGLEEDWIFEIGLTPNRIDAASHFGVARDLVAVINHQAQKKQLSLQAPDVEPFAVDNTSRQIPVIIEDAEACPRYSGLTISGIDVKPSPAWLKNRLMSIGLKPINNVVDATNFVLHELGQPLHAFDAEMITGDKVIIKKSPRGTVFETLDREKLELSGNDLMICHEDGPMCMAGILGGIDSGVTEQTKNIFLECACFDPVTIRKSANYHGLNTDASFRFERGADPDITVYALKRAAMLIKEIAGGAISSEVVDHYPGKKAPRIIQLSVPECCNLIGKQIPVNEMIGILRSLDFIILQESDDTLTLSVPGYRVDVSRQADVVEEILRIYGYNHVEIPHKLSSSIVLSPKPDKEGLQHRVSDLLTARGFYEIMNNSLSRASYYALKGFEPDRCVGMLNPLSQDLNVLRQSMLFGGLETIAYNQNRKVQDMRLYEFGNVYRKTGKQDAKKPLKAYEEQMMLAMFMTGKRHPENWLTQDEPTGFFDMKAAVMSVLHSFGLEEKQLQQLPVEDPLFDSCLSLDYGQASLARLGSLSDHLLKPFDIKQKVYYAEINWEGLIRLSSKQKLLYRDIPRFPEVRRDLALLVHAGLAFADIEKLAYKTETRLLKDVRLFDVYQDEKLGQDKKSYAVAFTLLDEKKTLTDKEIDKTMERLARAFEQELHATIRA